jgi:hypothetical protein
MMKNVLLTFDYELFLGKRSGTVKNCLIEPTNKILEILRVNNAKAIFFIDTTYLFVLSKKLTIPEVKFDYDLIVSQLKIIAAENHYLFHHLHPHWLDAEYIEDTNQWNLEKDARYKFESISEIERKEIFEFSTSFLCSIHSAGEQNSIINGFRAGGLCIHSFEHFLPYFNKYEIHHEFSLIETNENKSPYTFFESPEIKSSGPFFEYPISNIKLTGIPKALNGLDYRINKESKIPFGDGIPSVFSNNSIKSSSFIEQKFKLEIPLSIELLNKVCLRECLRMTNQRNYIHFLSHPKLVNDSSLYFFNRYLNEINRKHLVEYDFLKFNLSS